MSLVKYLNLKASPQSNEQGSNRIKWSDYSDLYISATSENGFTVLASKPAASLANYLLMPQVTEYKIVKSTSKRKL